MRDIHTDTDRWKGFVECSAGMGSVAMIHKPSFIKIGSGIQKLWRGYTDTDRIEMVLAYYRKVG
jgi:hypothetical protein